MKHIILFALLTLSLTSFSQTKSYSLFPRNTYGIRAGLDGTWFARGDNTYSGFKHAAPALISGLYGNIVVGTKLDIRIEAQAKWNGHKNVMEAPETFQTFGVQAPISLYYRYYRFNVQLGAYANYLFAARNHTFSGVNSFSWPVKDWSYYNRFTYGLVAGGGYDLDPINIEFHFMTGIKRVQNEYDKTKDLGVNQSMDLSLYFPIRLFYE